MIGNRVHDHGGYPYPHIDYSLFRLSFCKMDFSVTLNYPWYNALSERPQKCDLAIQKSTLLQAGEKFWLQELRYTDILTQALSSPGLEDEVSSRGLGTRWF